MYFDCRHPGFRNLNSTAPVDVVRVKSYVNSLLNSMRVPVRVFRSINLTLSQRGWCQVLLACSEMAEVWVCESLISLSCSLICSCMHLPVSPMYTIAWWGPAVCGQNVLINIKVTIMRQTINYKPFMVSLMRHSAWQIFSALSYDWENKISSGARYSHVLMWISCCLAVKKY